MVYDFDDIAAEHNWSRDKMLSVYEDFVYENDLDDKLGSFAAEVAAAENEAIHYTEEEDETEYNFDEDFDRDDVTLDGDITPDAEVSEWLNFQW